MARKERSPLRPELPRKPAVTWPGLPGGSLGLAVSRAASRHNGPTVLVCADSMEVQQRARELRAFDSAQVVRDFPDWETLPYDLFSPHPDIVSDRLAALYELPSMGQGILVVAGATLLQRLPPAAWVHGVSLKLAVGATFDMNVQRQYLESVGYRCVPQVTDHGEFSVRGALFDLFPMGSAAPYRVELLDDEIDSIRTFDPDTQLSRDKVDSINRLPAREFPFDEEAIRRFQQSFRRRFEIDLHQCNLYQDVKNGVAPAGIEYYLPLFFDNTEGLSRYMPANSQWILTAGVDTALDQFHAFVGDRYEQRRHDTQRPILSPEELYFSPGDLLRRIESEALARVEPTSDLDYSVRPAPTLRMPRRGDEETADLSLVEWQTRHPDARILVVADSAGRREAMADDIGRLGNRPERVASINAFLESSHSLAITTAALTDGFMLSRDNLVFLTERQLYGEHAKAVRQESERSKRDPASLIKDLTDLREGAPVVHEDYGVGRYLGLTRLDTVGMEAEFLTLEYAGNDKLYVPVASLDLISRYTGASPEAAPLHKLAGEQWTKAKKKAAEKARDVAAELLEIYAKREARPGQIMTADPADYDDFVETFPFEETTDQLAAINAVLTDMASDQSMDRVVCGDVGFGKTEVALRAAFVAVQAGKQVAILVPTTLLAQQHYSNFADRFANWPVRVEVLSRFRTAREVKSVLADAADGKVDILIGTHRLLQKDVAFKDLGLLVVDEEHRFGVRHKERIKRLRAEVDLLTLTATPIPRTLNMALSGLRDLSIIATAPSRRMAVKTFVKEWDTTLIREAVQRELQRGGQIYFLHNEIDTIEKTRRELQELFPEARMEVAHGQMREMELERIMLDFHRHRFNILICTTIIESGIDIPTANTIIINRADRFGLSQLHQLRGRVGRSHHRAYAYLVVPERRAMTSDARKRLEALESLDELGSGFTLATHDLEIRGAGELLGDEQTGQIQQIGFSLYTELLERSVAALKAGRIPDVDGTRESHVSVELNVPALIPDDYLPDVHTRLVLYKRIANARNSDGLHGLKVEMIDRFGMLPEQVRNLFAQAELKLDVARFGIRELDLGATSGRVVFDPDPPIEPMSVIAMVQREPSTFRFDGNEKLRIEAEMETADARLEMARRVLDQLEIVNAKAA